RRRRWTSRCCLSWFREPGEGFGGQQRGGPGEPLSRLSRQLLLLQEFREAAVLQDTAAALLLGAVVRLVFGEEDGLDLRAAAGAGVALVFVDLQRHRDFVGDLGADRLFVMVDCVA